VQTRRLAKSFEPLNSSLPLLAPELRPRKATCDPVVLVRKSPNPAGHQSVNDNCDLTIQAHATRWFVDVANKLCKR